jgi:hypothetical protein
MGAALARTILNWSVWFLVSAALVVAAIAVFVFGAVFGVNIVPFLLTGVAVLASFVATILVAAIVWIATLIASPFNHVPPPWSYIPNPGVTAPAWPPPTPVAIIRTSPNQPQPIVPHQASGSSGSCQGARGIDFAPQPGKSWKVGDPSTYRVVNFWTNWPGHPQTSFKLLLKPGENPSLNGGGSYWSWDGNCATLAEADYLANKLPEVTLDELVKRVLATR